MAWLPGRVVSLPPIELVQEQALAVCGGQRPAAKGRRIVLLESFSKKALRGKVGTCSWLGGGRSGRGGFGEDGGGVGGSARPMAAAEVAAA